MKVSLYRIFLVAAVFLTYGNHNVSAQIYSGDGAFSIGEPFGSTSNFTVNGLDMLNLTNNKGISEFTSLSLTPASDKSLRICGYYRNPADGTGYCIHFKNPYSGLYQSLHVGKLSSGLMTMPSNANTVNPIESRQTLAQLQPVQYRYSTPQNNNRLHFGFVAQEIEEVIPQMVSENTNGLKTVDQVSLIPILISTIHDLTSRIEENEKILAVLSGEIKSGLTGYMHDPGTHTTYFNYHLDGYVSGQITICDVYGNVVRTIECNSPNNKVSVLGLDSGMYIATLTINNTIVNSLHVKL